MRAEMLKEFRAVRDIHTGGFTIHDLLAYSKYSGPEWLAAITDNREFISMNNKDGLFLGLSLPPRLTHLVYETVNESQRDGTTLMFLKYNKSDEQFAKVCADIGIEPRYRHNHTWEAKVVHYSTQPITDELMEQHGYFRDKMAVIDRHWK